MIKRLLLLIILEFYHVLAQRSKDTEIHSLIIIKTPEDCSESEHNNEIKLSKKGFEMEEATATRMIGNYSDFIEKSIKSSRNVYALAANTTCHYQSVSYFSQKLLHRVKSNRFVAKEENIDYFPLSILRDEKDTIFQLRKCDVASKEVSKESFETVMGYAKNESVINLIEKIRNISYVQQSSHLTKLARFVTFEEFYEAINLDKSANLTEPEQAWIGRVYELFIYSQYYTDHKTAIGFMKPLISHLNFLVGEMQFHEIEDKETPREKKLFIFSVPKKIMLGFTHLLFAASHQNSFEQVSGFFLPKFNSSDKSYNLRFNSSDILTIEVFKSDPEKLEKSFNFLQLEDMILDFYNRTDKYYAIQGNQNGIDKQCCGPFVGGQCLMIDLMKYLLLGFDKIEVKTCKIRERIGDVYQTDIVGNTIIFATVIMVGYIMNICIQISQEKAKKDSEEVIRYSPLETETQNLDEAS